MSYYSLIDLRFFMVRPLSPIILPPGVFLPSAILFMWIRLVAMEIPYIKCRIRGNVSVLWIFILVVFVAVDLDLFPICWFIFGNAILNDLVCECGIMEKSLSALCIYGEYLYIYIYVYYYLIILICLILFSPLKYDLDWFVYFVHALPIDAVCTLLISHSNCFRSCESVISQSFRHRPMISSSCSHGRVIPNI